MVHGSAGGRPTRERRVCRHRGANTERCSGNERREQIVPVCEPRDPEGRRNAAVQEDRARDQSTAAGRRKRDGCGCDDGRSDHRRLAPAPRGPAQPVQRRRRDRARRHGPNRRRRGHPTRSTGRAQGADRSERRSDHAVPTRGVDHRAPAAPRYRASLRGRTLAERRAVLRDEDGLGPPARQSDRRDRFASGTARVAPAPGGCMRCDGVRAQPADHPSRPQARQRADR